MSWSSLEAHEASVTQFTPAFIGSVQHTSCKDGVCRDAHRHQSTALTEVSPSQAHLAGPPGRPTQQAHPAGPPGRPTWQAHPAGPPGRPILQAHPAGLSCRPILWPCRLTVVPRVTPCGTALDPGSNPTPHTWCWLHAQNLLVLARYYWQETVSLSVFFRPAAHVLLGSSFHC